MEARRSRPALTLPSRGSRLDSMNEGSKDPGAASGGATLPGGRRRFSPLRFLVSVRLAAALIAWLALSSMLATLVPQGREPEFYASAYGALGGRLVLATGLASWFHSLPFILPAFLFLANLSTCATARLLRELKKSGGRRHGPDLLHLALVLLALGALLSVLGRREYGVRLAAGEAAALPDGRLLRVTELERQAWEDGRPREWTTRVELLKDEAVVRAAYPIRVNHPLRLGSLSIYQSSFEELRSIRLRDPAGGELRLSAGDGAEAGDFRVEYVADEENGPGVVLRLGTGEQTSTLLARAGAAVGPLTVAEISSIELTGLAAVADPGYPLVLPALLLLLAGMGLSLIQKLGDTQT